KVDLEPTASPFHRGPHVLPSSGDPDQLARNRSIASNPRDRVVISVANDSRAYPSAPNAEPMTVATWADLSKVMQNEVESVIRSPPRVRPKCSRTSMKA